MNGRRSRSIRSAQCLRAVCVVCMLMIGCSGNADSQGGGDSVKGGAPPPKPTSFPDYWYQGKAELTRYDLEQARYGEIRRGDALMIFVTEDFLADRQVKLESDPEGKNVTKILKLNFVKKFQTGIYPYSLMTSVFTPLTRDSIQRSLKITTTVQEWCGHVFSQLNLRGGRFDVHTYSYFEREGDQSFGLEGVMAEDEIWSIIRRLPSALPTGRISIIPGTMTTRLRHTPLRVMTATATATLAAAQRDSLYGPLMRYTVVYEDRTLAIDFQQEFPYGIIGWTETYRDGFGPNARELTTRARRTHQLITDYWRRNSTADDSLRRELGLP